MRKLSIRAGITASPSPYDLLASNVIGTPWSSDWRPPSHEGFRLLPLAQFRGWSITLCEAAVGRDLPSYFERRGWRERIGEPFRSGIIIFTDPMHSAYVWSWRQPRPVEAAAYVEHHIPGREARLIDGLQRLPDLGNSSLVPEPTGKPSALCKRVLECLLSSFSCGPEAPTPCPTAVQLWIEEISNSRQLRSVWAATNAFAVLDARCGIGERLIQIAEILEPVYLALLERMSSFVDDDALHRAGIPRIKLQDLREIVDGSEQSHWESGRHTFVRRKIVQKNLHGAVIDREELRSAADTVLRYAEITSGEAAILDCNLSIGTPSELAERHPPPPRGRGRSPEIAQATDPLEEEIAILRAAWAAVREPHYSRTSYTREITRAARQIEKRRATLLRQVRRLGSGGRYSDSRLDSLVFRLRFATVATPGDFSLVLRE